MIVLTFEFVSFVYSTRYGVQCVPKMAFFIQNFV